MKKITDLTLEEFTKVMEDNGEADVIFQDALDDAFLLVNDVLSGFSTIDYSVDYCGYSYLKVRGAYGYSKPLDLRNFFYECYEHDYAIFSEERRKDIEHYIDRAEFYCSEEMSDENDNRLYEWLYEKAAGLCDEVLDYCKADIDYHADNSFEHARDCGFYDDYAVDDDGTLFIPSDITYLVNGKTFTSYSDAQEEYNRTKALTAQFIF